MSFKENDFVRILSEPIGSINEEARVVKVTTSGVYLSNLNMPFIGTLCNEFFAFDNIEKIAKTGE